jgi:GAF domain-containing protein
VEPLPETREALAELVTLDGPEVDDLLVDLGRRAAAVVPDLVGLSLGLSREGVTFTLVASSSGVGALDAAQYVDGGPCVEVTEGRATQLETDPLDPLDEEHWRLFAEVGAASGVGSTLSLPVYRDGRLIGGLNLYAATANAFRGRQDALAQIVDAQGLEAVSNADLSFSSRQRALAAPGILHDQQEVDTAVGLIAALQGVEVEVAERRLREAAARAGVSEALVARVLVLALRPGRSP